MQKILYIQTVATICSLACQATSTTCRNRNRRGSRDHSGSCGPLGKLLRAL